MKLTAQHIKRKFTDLNKIDERKVRRQMIASARMLRIGMGVLALLLPILLWRIGGAYGLPLQASMSDYYIAWPEGQCGFFPARDILVGFVCAISFGLLAYKGFNSLEDRLLDVAGVAGVLIAFFPNNLVAEQAQKCAALQPILDGQKGIAFVHDAASFVMFIALGLVVLCCARNTLFLVKKKAWKDFLEWTYPGIGVLMILAPFAGLAVNEIFQAKSRIFFTEWFALWLFATYWLLKVAELGASKGELKLIAPKDIPPTDLPPPGGAAAPAN